MKNISLPEIQNKTLQFTRLGRNEMSYLNLQNFNEKAGDRICEALLVHICVERDFNMFGFGCLDPREFAERFGFSEEYLLHTHDNPYQKKLQKFSTDEYPNLVCNSRIENAFYILATVPINGMTSHIDEGRIIRRFDPVRVIKRFEFIYDLTTGRKKIIYEVSKELLIERATYYKPINPKSVAELRRSSLVPLYYYLIMLRDALYYYGKTSTTPDNTPQFDKLLKIAEINTTTKFGGSERQKEPRFIKRDLNAAFEKIKKTTELNFDVQWCNNTNSDTIYKYIPVFHFNPTFDDVIEDPENEQEILKKKLNKRIDILASEFRYNLIEFSCTKNKGYFDDAGKRFFVWLKNLDVKTTDPIFNSQLISMITNTYIETGNVSPSTTAVYSILNSIRNNGKTKAPEEFTIWTRELFTTPETIPVPAEIISEEKTQKKEISLLS